MTLGFLDMAGLSHWISRSPRWVRANLSWLPHFRVHSQILFRPDEILEAMERFRVEPKDINLRGLLDKVIPTRRGRGSHQKAAR
jgi:hypothetical protein